MRALCSGLFEFQFVGNYSQECPIDAIANFINQLDPATDSAMCPQCPSSILASLLFIECSCCLVAEGTRTSSCCGMSQRDLNELKEKNPVLSLDFTSDIQRGFRCALGEF